MTLLPPRLDPSVGTRCPVQFRNTAVFEDGGAVNRSKPRRRSWTGPYSRSWRCGACQPGSSRGSGPSRFEPRQGAVWAGRGERRWAGRHSATSRPCAPVERSGTRRWRYRSRATTGRTTGRQRSWCTSASPFAAASRRPTECGTAPSCQTLTSLMESKANAKRRGLKKQAVRRIVGEKSAASDWGTG